MTIQLKDNVINGEGVLQAENTMRLVSKEDLIQFSMHSPDGQIIIKANFKDARNFAKALLIMTEE